MSDAGDIVTALEADWSSALAGVTIQREPITAANVRDGDVPLVTVLHTEYDTETLAYRQENRVWTITGALYHVKATTRAQMETHLEAFRAQVEADPTLGGAVDHATLAAAIPDTHPDGAYTAGVWAVRAEKVA